ncbi:MurR/RpiR family transcriptional regulator [Propionibacteriaceae bacterium Y1685]
MTRHLIAPVLAEQNSVINRVESMLPELGGMVGRIGRFVVDHPRAVVDYSITELAEETQTSAATVTRFCRAVGFARFVDFRLAMASDVGRGTAETWKADIGREFQPDDAPEVVLSTLISAHTRSLEETAAAMDLALMQQLANRIASCRHFDIHGIGGSAVMAKELHSRLYRIGINCHHWSELHAGLTSAAIQDETCVAMAISNTGRTESMIQVLETARRAGAFTVALTNNPQSPLSDVADLQLTTSVFGRFLQPDDLAAKHVQLLVIDLLYLLVAQQNFKQTSSNLAATAVAVSDHRRSPRRRSQSGPTPARGSAVVKVK